MLLAAVALSPLFAAPMVTTVTYFPGQVPLTEEVIMENKRRKVVRFDITGISQENLHIIRSIVDLKAGDYLVSIDPRRVREQLNESGLFSQFGLFYRPHREGYVVTLRVKEKKEVIATPFFTLSESDVHAGGLLLTESPFEIEPVSGASELRQPGGIEGIIRYINPRLQGQTQKMEMIFTGDQLSRAHTDSGSDIIRQFRGYSANLDFNWSFRNDAKFSPTGILQYDLFEVDTAWKETLNPTRDSELVSTGFELVYNDYYLIHFFNEGFQVGLKAFQKYLLLQSRNIYSCHITADRNMNPVSTHRLHIGLRGGFNPAPPVILGFLRGPGHLLLPTGSSVDRLYGSVFSEYEVPVQRNPWGTLTAFAFTEAGLYSPLEEVYQFYYGPGLGFHLYLHGLASPVFGASLGLNLDRNYLASSLFAGIQF